MDLKTLCEAFGPSGAEHEVRALIKEAAIKLCDDVSIDRSGNVVARKKGTDARKPSVTFAAHMDEIGFIVTGHTEDGMLRFRPIGGVDPRVVVSKWVALGKDRTKGVIGAMAIHLQTPADRERVLDYDNLFIDIGAKDSKEAEKLCPLGTYAVFDTPYTEFGDGFVAARALDDRVGCLNLLEVLKSDYAGDLCCVFVTQEEVGLRGSQGAAFHIQPDIAIILEGTAGNDLGETPSRFQVVRPGEGVAISFMDHASIADRELFVKMQDVAREQGIPHQIKRAITGGNDAGSFQQTGKGARTCVLSVPCRYIHSGNNVAKLSDIQAQGELARAFLNSL
ncbi:MAG: M42 family metallopeptidase [Clostridiales bacterium]|jgi:endoglucanase|nr:M42 family metallopeptidase [Clostridiales bacterium]